MLIPSTTIFFSMISSKSSFSLIVYLFLLLIVPSFVADERSSFDSSFILDVRQKMSLFATLYNSYYEYVGSVRLRPYFGTSSKNNNIPSTYTCTSSCLNIRGKLHNLSLRKDFCILLLCIPHMTMVLKHEVIRVTFFIRTCEMSGEFFNA